ncbi:hypothetical protein MKX01_007829 [Papaver californicum]|nr:hypothetical protein MKX01_007829 [Papaver californicum]
MKGQLSKEVEAPVPASDLWDVYATLELKRLIKELLPEILRDFEIVVGDGGVGTVLKLTFPPESPVADYTEKFTKVVAADFPAAHNLMNLMGGILNK